MDDVGYFLSKPGTLKRVPQLLLISNARSLHLERLIADDLMGAVLLYKYTVLGCGIGIVHFGRELCEFILRPDWGFSFTKGSFSDSISLDRSTFIDGFIQLGSQSLIMNIMSSLRA